MWSFISGEATNDWPHQGTKVPNVLSSSFLSLLLFYFFSLFRRRRCQLSDGFAPSLYWVNDNWGRFILWRGRSGQWSITERKNRYDSIIIPLKGYFLIVEIGRKGEDEGHVGKESTVNKIQRNYLPNCKRKINYFLSFLLQFAVKWTCAAVRCTQWATKRTKAIDCFLVNQVIGNAMAPLKAKASRRLHCCHQEAIS